VRPPRGPRLISWRRRGSCSDLLPSYPPGQGVMVDKSAGCLLPRREGETCADSSSSTTSCWMATFRARAATSGGAISRTRTGDGDHGERHGRLAITAPMTLILIFLCVPARDRMRLEDLQPNHNQVGPDRMAFNDDHARGRYQCLRATGSRHRRAKASANPPCC